MPKNTNQITYRSYRTASLRRRIGHVVGRKRLIYTYLDTIFTGVDGFDAVGFKFMYDQANRYSPVIDWCRDFDVRVIHLIRKNILKMIVSRLIARKRGIYASTKVVRPTTVSLDIANVVAEIRKLEAIVARNRKAFSGLPVTEIFYEDFVVNYDDECRRMLAFLDTDTNEQLSCDLKKTSPDSLDALIENYEEVCQALSGSRYESFLA